MVTGSRSAKRRTWYHKSNPPLFIMIYLINFSSYNQDIASNLATVSALLKQKIKVSLWLTNEYQPKEIRNPLIKRLTPKRPLPDDTPAKKKAIKYSLASTELKNKLSSAFDTHSCRKAIFLDDSQVSFLYFYFRIVSYASHDYQLTNYNGPKIRAR